MIVAESSLHETIAQRKVQDFLDELTSTGQETGIQVAAYLNGELVVDACSGIANPATNEAVTPDTLFVSFSTSKGVTATLIHQLVEKGKLDYDAAVADYWPEFAKNGKAAVTLRHVLRHQAGIPQTPKEITPESFLDWKATVRAVENLKPLWKAGKKTAYHGLTYGIILGELAQRVDNRSFSQMVQEDMCKPLGISDMYFGLPAELEPRVAIIGGDSAPFMRLPSFFLIKKIIPRQIEPGPIWNKSAMRRAVIPAGNLITTARSLARHYAALCGDGVDGKRLLSPERVKIATVRTNERDWAFFGARLPKGLGYWVGGEADSALGTRSTAFGHTGSGSMIAFADPEYNFSFAVLKNKQTWQFGEDTDLRAARLVREVLGIPH